MAATSESFLRVGEKVVETEVPKQLMELVDFEPNPDHGNEMDGAEEYRFQLSVSGEERPATAHRMNTIPVMASATLNGNDVIPQVSHLSTSPMPIPVSSYPLMATPQQPTSIYPGTYSGNQGYMPQGQHFHQVPPGMYPTVPYSMSNGVFGGIQPPYMLQPPPGYSHGYQMFPYGYGPGMYPNYGYPTPPPPGYLTPSPPPGYTALMPQGEVLPQGQVLPEGHLGETPYNQFQGNFQDVQPGQPQGHVHQHQPGGQSVDQRRGQPEDQAQGQLGDLTQGQLRYQPRDQPQDQHVDKTQDQPHGESDDQLEDLSLDQPPLALYEIQQCAAGYDGLDDIPPTGLKFNGDDYWVGFKHKFMRYAEARNWTLNKMRDQLCWSLEGKASDFYASAVQHDGNLGFNALLQKLEKRFGGLMSPDTAQDQLSTSQQHIGESIDDWADRVMQLALRAYPNLPEEFMLSQAVKRICHGCTDKEAGQYVANLNLGSFELVVDKLKCFQFNHQTIYGNNTSMSNICEVSVSSSQESSNEDQSELFAHVRQPEQHLDPTLDRRIDSLDERMEHVQADLQSLLRLLESLKSEPRSASN